LKNSPYARHHQFRTTYKSQGQSFDNVVIDWDDLPGKDHKYVAISRAKNSCTLITD
jgi:ATP-dependent exoDNAse (exonuclease V) alpha subunit